MPIRSILIASIISFLLATSCGDGYPGTIELRPGSAPPTFHIRGPGQVQWIWFQGPLQNPADPAPELKGPDDPQKIIVWKIRPPHDVPANQLPDVTYGQVPLGWDQEAPAQGPPPKLLDGYVYYVGVVYDRGAGPEMCIFVKNGQVQPYRDKDEKTICGRNNK